MTATSSVETELKTLQPQLAAVRKEEADRITQLELSEVGESSDSGLLFTGRSSRARSIMRIAGWAHFRYPTLAEI